MGLFKSSGAVGLEMDTGVIRAVEMKGSANAAVLTAAAQVEIPEDAVVEGVVADVDAVAGALSRLWSESGIRKRNVVLGISNQGVMMRLANFPRVPEKKLAQVLSYQAGEYFPIPMSQMVFDFSVMRETEGENGPELEILLVAARRDMLDKSLASLAAASLNPIIVDAAPLALLRTFTEDRLAGTIVLADISNGLTSLLLIANGIPRFARVIPHSLQYMSHELNVPLPRVLEAMRQASAALEPGAGFYGGGVPLDWGVTLAREIRSSIGYYLAQNNGAAVDRVVLSGRGSRVRELPDLLQDELEVPVEIFNPLDRIKDTDNVQGVNMDQEGPDFAVGIGLALRGLEA